QGVFIHSYEGESLRIELAKNLLQYGSDQAILGTLKHELVHYALFEQDKPCEDGDEYFENELRRVGAPSTGTNRVGVYYTYSCGTCGKISETKTKRLWERPQYYSTRCCGGGVVPIERRTYNGDRCECPSCSGHVYFNDKYSARCSCGVHTKVLA